MKTDAAVPGQSLTDTPGNAKWESPPQYTNLEEAADYIFTQLNRPKNLSKVLAFLDVGVPVEAITNTILFAGFSEGKWTPDLAMLLVQPVAIQLIGIARAAGYDHAKIRLEKIDEEQTAKDIYALNLSGKEDDVDEEEQESANTGLLPELKE